jgi:hypothetical protein
MIVTRCWLLKVLYRHGQPLAIGAKVDVLKVCGQAKLAGRKQKKRRGRFTAIINHTKFLISLCAISRIEPETDHPGPQHEPAETEELKFE